MKAIPKCVALLSVVLLLTACGGTALPSNNCGPLPAPTNTIYDVDTVQALVQAVQDANQSGGNRTIRVAAGTYRLGHTLLITQPDISIRGATGNRADVTLLGNGMSGDMPHVFLVRADRFTVADLTLGQVANHGIQIQGDLDADDLLVHNVRFIDTGEQMLKGSFNPADTSVGSDRGIVRCSRFEYTAGIGPQFYIGGIDVHNGADWAVRDNVFADIRSPDDSLAEHAIHFWSNSSNTLVERNTIVDCDRGIGFGMGNRGHIGGMIRNNMVYTTRDVGIGLESARGTQVLNNSVYADNYGSAIEYRFSATSGVTIRGNLTRGSIWARDGASGDVSNNYTNAIAAFFVDYAKGNLRLASRRPEVVDQAPPAAQVVDDIDGRARPVGSASDLGAHEWGN